MHAITLTICPAMVRMLMQGNCPDAPSEALLAKVAGAPLLPLQSRQCLILSDLSFLFAQDTKVWLDGLYVRHIVTPRTTNWNDGLIDIFYGSAWLTSVTLQGGSEMPESKLYETRRKRVNKYTRDKCGVCGMSAVGKVYLESALLTGCANSFCSVGECK